MIATETNQRGEGGGEGPQVAQAGSTTRRKKLLVLAILGLIVLAVVPLPFGITTADRERAVGHTLDALYHNHFVLSDQGFSRLYDTKFVKDKARIYFQNDLGIPDTVFLSHGLRPIPTDRELNVDQGDVIISFSEAAAANRLSTRIHFSYVYGSLGAQGYEIRVYTSLLIRYFVYIHSWVS